MLGLIHIALFIRNQEDLTKVDKFLSETPEARMRLTIHLMWPIPPKYLIVCHRLLDTIRFCYIWNIILDISLLT
jgi:hypothetical protein